MRAHRRHSLITRAKQEQRDGDRLTVAEDAEFRRLTAEISTLDERISELDEQSRRSRAAANAYRHLGGRYGGAFTSHMYGPESRASYFANLAAVARQTADYDARSRLATYEQEQRDLNRADGSGGMFVPPAWLVSDYAGSPRPGRVTADLLTRRPLPAATDTINIPKILTGTAVAVQPADNDPVWPGPHHRRPAGHLDPATRPVLGELR